MASREPSSLPSKWAWASGHLTVSGDGTKLFATRFVTPPLPGEATAAPGTQGGGQVQQLTAASLALGPLVVLAHSNAAASERSGPGVPNYLGALAISPDGLSAAVPSKQDNIRRGTRRSGQPLTHDSTVRAITSRLSLQTGQENLAGRIDHDDASVASAAAFDAYGAYLFSALEGNRTVAVLEAYSGGQLNRALVGRAPQALALSADGSRLYVQNFMDRTVTVLDLSRLRDFDDSALPVVATIPTTGSERLSAQVLRGKQFFYDAADPRLALQGYMACAACHNDGGSDGRTWDFTQFGEGLRNTIGLKGHGVGQGRLHWTANFDEVQDFEGQIRSFAGGTGLMSDAAFFSGTVSQPLGSPKAGLSADLDALAAYVQSLTATGASPHRNQDGSRTTQGEAGRALFVGAGCASCHAGAPFTDSQAGGMHDVGTLQPTSGSFAALDTPTLRGVWATAPYLHDGSAATLSQAVQRHTGVVFDATQLASVAAYLLQIDDRESSAADTAPPGSVTGLTATAVSTTQINLSWASATDDVGVTGYRVERCQGAGCSNFTQIAAPSGSSYVRYRSDREHELQLSRQGRRCGWQREHELFGRGNGRYAGRAGHDAARQRCDTHRDGGERKEDQSELAGGDRQRRSQRIQGGALPRRRLHQLRADRDAHRDLLLGQPAREPDQCQLSLPRQGGRCRGQRQRLLLSGRNGGHRPQVRRDLAWPMRFSDGPS